MRRRAFIALLGGVAAMPALSRHGARAQQSTMPVIGFLSSRSKQQAQHLLAPVLAGLQQAGFTVERNCTLEERYADGHYDRLPELAKSLVQQRVAVIVAGGTSDAAIAATKTIPIVFTSGLDPVPAGLVSSLSRPGGNATGVTFYSGALGGKRMGFLRQVAPDTATFGLLVNPASPLAAPQIEDANTAAATIKCNLQILNVDSNQAIENAIATFAKAPNAALLIATDPYFDSRTKDIVGLTATYAVPTAYYLREFVQAGGLISYGASITDVYRQAGVYAGRILKGESPGDLPVQLPTRFELAINLKTARTLGLTVPVTLQASADQVIE